MHCCFHVPIFFSFWAKKSPGLCELAQSCCWVGQGHRGDQPMCQPFQRTVSLFRVQESMDGSVQNSDCSLQNDLWRTSWGLHTFWKSRGIVKTLEVRCSQHLASADGFNFLKITLQREMWPMGHSRKIELNKTRERFMTWMSCFLGGQGKGTHQPIGLIMIQVD